MIVNRETLLQTLEAVTPGIAKKEAVEQGTCFVFDGATVATFNGYTCCRMPCNLGFIGAVGAAAIRELLVNLKEEDITISATAGELIIEGNRRRAGFALQATITLPTGDIDQPTEWREVHPDFADALMIAAQCVAKEDNSDNNFAISCFHLSPTFVEATDNFQLTRFPVATGLRGDTLLRQDSAKHVAALGMTMMGETQHWVHFRNPAGLMLSCRKYAETEAYPNIGDALVSQGGSPVLLPPGLEDAVVNAEIFSKETSENNRVEVALREGAMKLRSQGPSGWYEEIRQLEYNGPQLRFLIAPDMLVAIAKRSMQCLISQNRLHIDGGKFVYVSCLGTPKD